MVDADAHGATVLFAGFDDGDEAFFYGQSLGDVLFFQVLRAIGVAVENEQTRVYADFVDVLGGFDGDGGAFYQAHFYTNPVLFWLEVVTDFPCLERGAFDLAYLTEVDPLWNDDELTLILNPEAVLFANPVAVAACAADCVAATAGFGIAGMFWCAGCQGGLYPLDGQVPYHGGGVRSASLIAQRLTAKLHRELIAWGWHGRPGLCGPYFLPVMDKTAYKTQLTYPVANTAKEAGRCCQPFGRTTIVWGAGKEVPVRGEDFAFLLFRKRNCCVGF
jgi:conjugal transfer pilus assembly protein TraU